VVSGKSYDFYDFLKILLAIPADINYTLSKEKLFTKERDAAFSNWRSKSTYSMNLG
jgi:hypothetical protein